MSSHISRKERRRLARENAPVDKPPAAPQKALTIMDVHEAYQKGYDAGHEAGFHAAAHPVIRSTYAAILSAAHELYGFGQTRGIRLLNKVNYILTETLSSEELAQKAFDEIGVEIDWTEPIEYAQPKEPIRKKGIKT